MIVNKKAKKKKESITKDCVDSLSGVPVIQCYLINEFIA